MKKADLERANKLIEKIRILDKRISKLDELIKTPYSFSISTTSDMVVVSNDEDKQYIYDYLKGVALKEKKIAEEEFESI